MKPVGLLIFDLDGTLVDTLDDIAASVNHTLAKLGNAVISRDAVRQYVGDGIETLMVRALGKNTEQLAEAVDIYKAHQRDNLIVRTRLYPSVREALDSFASIPMAVVTNKTKEFSAPLLDRLGIGRYFTMLIGADNGLPLKPAPDALISIMKRLGIPRERTVMVGDGTTDIRAGKAAGIETCAVTYGFRSEEELRKAGPDYVIHDCSELKNLFAPDK